MSAAAPIEQMPTPDELAPEVQPGPRFKGKAAEQRIRQLLVELKELRGIVSIKEPLTEQQQEWFNRAFKKKEAKLRAEYEEKLSRSNADLLETVTLAYRLLKKCDDRMSRADAREIEVGLLEITREYGNSRTN
jgi:adenine C2-methylase RlmN of 23S rRNA A2503 and tRNA A37